METHNFCHLFLISRYCKAEQPDRITPIDRGHCYEFIT